MTRSYLKQNVAVLLTNQAAESYSECLYSKERDECGNVIGVLLQYGLELVFSR